jgi:hypothetical protein
LKITRLAHFSAAVFLGSAIAALAQPPSPASAAPSKPNDTFRPRGRHLLYVVLPGSLEQPGWLNGAGILSRCRCVHWGFEGKVDFFK